jgi:hypothetical protein
MAGALLPRRKRASENRRKSSAAGLAAPLDPPRRRSARLSPIGSLAYFRPVIEKLLENPALKNYRDYLQLKLRQAIRSVPATDRKPTFSNER